MRKLAGARPMAACIAALFVTTAALAAAAITSASPAFAARPTPTTGVPAPPRAWVLVDSDSGTVLSASNDHEALYPASTAKLMTALVAIEKLQLNGSIVVSDLAAGKPAMKIGMHTGEQWPITDALRSLLIVSANDAAVALAEASSGSLDRFAKDAGAIGARLGMHDSTWRDPAGLDDEFSNGGGTTASAYDLAIAARNVLSVPALAEIAALPEYRFTGPDGHGHILRNHDRLLTRYEGAIGLKTGYTRKAGHTLVAAAKRGGRTMIAVVLGADDSYGAAGALLDTGFVTPADAPGTGEHLPLPKVTPAGSPSGGSLAKPTFLPATKQAAKSTTATPAKPRKHHYGRMLLFGGLVLLFVARRRQIKRRRTRRLARRRAPRQTGPRQQPIETQRRVTRPTQPVPLIDLSDLPELDFPFEFDDELAERRRVRIDDEPRRARNSR